LEQTDQLNVALQTGDVVIGIRESLPDALPEGLIFFLNWKMLFLPWAPI